MYHVFINNLSTDGKLCWFYLLVTVNRAAVNMVEALSS